MFAITPIFISVMIICETVVLVCSAKPATVIGTFIMTVPTGSSTSSISGSGAVFGLLCFLFLTCFSRDLG